MKARKRSVRASVWSIFTAVSLVATSLGLLAVPGPVAAGCGWPTCRPAKLGAGANQKITPPGGSAGTISVTFSSTASYPVAETWVSFSGRSAAAWGGPTPKYAKSVRLVDHWHADGLAVSVGYPSGVGMTGSGQDAYWDDIDTATWNVQHNFSNVKFSGAIIYGIRETVSGYFKFGTASWNINADDDCLI